MFDLSEIGSALAELMEERSTPEEAKMEVDEEVDVLSVMLGESASPSQKALTGINVSFAAQRKLGLGPKLTRPSLRLQNLPDELLLKVFGMLSDHYGFRVKVRGARWYNPPSVIMLVCRRWLPVSSDDLFCYQFNKYIDLLYPPDRSRPHLPRHRHPPPRPDPPPSFGADHWLGLIDPHSLALHHYPTRVYP